MSDLLNWQDTMTFGKYKGQTIEEVASLDSQYLIWANENVDYFNLDFKVLKTIEELKQSKELENDLRIHDSAYDEFENSYDGLGDDLEEDDFGEDEFGEGF